MINCFCCYVIKSSGETTTKVLLSVIWNPLLIEINLSLKLGYRTVNARKYVRCVRIIKCYLETSKKVFFITHSLKRLKNFLPTDLKRILVQTLMIIVTFYCLTLATNFQKNCNVSIICVSDTSSTSDGMVMFLHISASYPVSDNMTVEKCTSIVLLQVV